MKKTGILKAMKLCRDYERMGVEEREKLRSARLNALVEWARKNSPYYSELYKDLPENYTLSDLPPAQREILWSPYMMIRQTISWEESQPAAAMPEAKS